MNSAVKHCALQYKKILSNKKLEKTIHDSFASLEREIKNLSYIDQINLYSIAVQLLDSLVHQPNNAVNALEVFNLRCQSIIGTENDLLKTICLGLAALVITIAVLSVSLSIGVGLGMLMGFWQLPSAFVALLATLETSAVVTTATSVGVGLAVSGVITFGIFKPSKITSAVNDCVEAVKESYLSDFTEDGSESLVDTEQASEEMPLRINQYQN